MDRSGIRTLKPVYAGLKPGTTAADLRTLSEHTANKYLASFTPQRGQAILIEAGVVHSLGNGLVVFELQENSDVTFRLYDWNHIPSRRAIRARCKLRRRWLASI